MAEISVNIPVTRIILPTGTHQLIIGDKFIKMIEFHNLSNNVPAYIRWDGGTAKADAADPDGKKTMKLLDNVGWEINYEKMIKAAISVYVPSECEIQVILKN